MNTERIVDPNDTRIGPYRELKEKRLAQEQGLFVVEGKHLVERLLASHIKTHSVLMSDAQCKSGEWEIPRDIPVYLASKEVLSTIVGFKFHRGVLALGRRPVPLSLVKAWPGIAEISRLLILPEINDVENLGAILRTAAGLGFGHVLLGPACCDPWSRRAIRTSMGAVFRLAIRRSNALQSDLERLRQDHGFRYHATVLDKSAMPLAAVEIPQKVGLILGPEADGLSDAWQSLADERVTIVMDLDTDSLNVTVAAGIFMYHYRRP